MAVVMAVAFSGCDGAPPVTPNTTVNDLHIAATCLVLPAGAPPGIAAGITAVIREDGDSGAPVPGLEVTLNGEALSFDQSEQEYVGPPPSAQIGNELALRIADAGAALVRITGVPESPYDLRLSDGHWYTSSDDDVNQLIWNNTTWGYDAIRVLVYDYNPSSGTATLLYSRFLDADAMWVSIRNDELAYYSTMTSATCLVCQTNTVDFPHNPDTSRFTVATGVWGNWPCEAGR